MLLGSHQCRLVLKASRSCYETTLSANRCGLVIDEQSRSKSHGRRIDEEEGNTLNDRGRKYAGKTPLALEVFLCAVTVYCDTIRSSKHIPSPFSRDSLLGASGPLRPPLRLREPRTRRRRSTAIESDAALLAISELLAEEKVEQCVGADERENRWRLYFQALHRSICHPDIERRALDAVFAPTRRPPRTHGKFAEAPSVKVALACLARILALRDPIGAEHDAPHGIRTRQVFTAENVPDDVGNPESSVEDPFRHQITEAIQWYSNLCARIEKRLNRVILENSMAPSDPNRGRAHDDLVQRCPACFNLNEWGRSGGDVHVGIDGNRTHKHNSNAGDGPTGHEPLFFLPRSLVDFEGKRIADVRLGHSTSYDPEIPDDVVNKCAKTYAAANEKLGKPISPKFDETGIFHLSCRHNIPLFVASMNTLGEEHKYFVTLLSELMARLPPQATVCLFSDVACIIERALRSYPLLPEDVVKRLRLSLNALHCRRHEHGCKMVLSPRLQTGLGLTDGEFVERLLSMLRNRITPTRSQWAERRIWTLEQQLDFIANKERSNLGRWLTRCRAHVQQELDRATSVLRTCGISIPQLRREWDSRKLTAKTLDDHDDTDVEIEKLLELQMAFEQLDKKLAQTMPHRHAANTVFKEMRVSLTGTKARIDDIYNVEIAQRFPSLADTKLGFLKKMFMARDLKRTIRRLASISFSKWETLDQAKGGRGAPVGTTAAASLHRSIGQDAPQLMAALHKYNALCNELSETPRSSHDIQCPSSLPTKLSELREDPNLLRDISIHQGDQQNPDPTMQDKVEAMLTVDRCIEEHARILQEGRNITDWVENRLSAISTAVSQQENMLFTFPLLRHQKHLRRLSEEWKDLVLSLSLPLEGILSNDASGFELAFIPAERKDRVPISELLGK
ncbi:hypothetical protein DFH06DRAFT_1486276 [Mycena polygramma]|nr:hypothetical protein DFH06DRAFT_1486276 [Mycena polygramma]